MDKKKDLAIITRQTKRRGEKTYFLCCNNLVCIVEWMSELSSLNSIVEAFVCNSAWSELQTTLTNCWYMPKQGFFLKKESCK